MRKPISDIPALRFGSLIHKALAEFYPPGIKRGPKPAATFRRVYQEELNELGETFGQRVQRDAEEDEIWVDAGTLGEAMLEHYYQTYGRDEQYKVLVTEQLFEELVLHPVTFEPWFVYVGVLDGIWEDRQTGHPFIVDHKTTKAIQTAYLAMDDQATAYWTYGLDWVYKAGIIGKDVKPSGMMYNLLRKAAKDERPQNDEGYYLNKSGEVSKQQPSPYFARHPVWRDFREREKQRERVREEFQDMQRVRLREIDHYKNPGMFTCPMCWAFDICELDEVGAPGAEDMKEQTTRLWEPYHRREVYAGDTK
jgi:hypothetical protein